MTSEIAPKTPVRITNRPGLHVPADVVGSIGILERYTKPHRYAAVKVPGIDLIDGSGVNFGNVWHLDPECLEPLPAGARLTNTADGRLSYELDTDPATEPREDLHDVLGPLGGDGE